MLHPFLQVSLVAANPVPQRFVYVPLLYDSAKTDFGKSEHPIVARSKTIRGKNPEEVPRSAFGAGNLIFFMKFEDDDEDDEDDPHNP